MHHGNRRMIIFWDEGSKEKKTEGWKWLFRTGCTIPLGLKHLQLLHHPAAHAQFSGPPPREYGAAGQAPRAPSFHESTLSRLKVTASPQAKKSRHGRGILTHGGRSKNKQQRCSAAKAGSWHGHRRPACCQCQGTHATLRPGRYRPPPRRQVAYSYDCVRRRRRYPSCSAPLTRSPGAGRGWGWGARCRWVPTSSSCAIPRRFRWPFGL
jgi:hypothetical protein